MLRAGVDTAETGYLQPGLRKTIKHTAARTAMVRETITAAYSGYLYPTLTYMTHLQLPEPLIIKKIGVRYLKESGELIISDIFTRDF